MGHYYYCWSCFAIKCGLALSPELTTEYTSSGTEPRVVCSFVCSHRSSVLSLLADNSSIIIVVDVVLCMHEHTNTPTYCKYMYI